MTHLSRETLIAWRDHPADHDRAVVVPHLASCAACAAAYAELVRVRPDVDPPSVFDPEQFKARGLAARSRSRRPFQLPRWLFVPVTVAAALMLVVVVNGPGDDTPVTRGGGILQAVAPTGPVPSAALFTWDAPADADLFRIEIVDTSGRLLHEARVRDRTYAVPPDVAGQFVLGVEYRWTVSRIDSRGETLETSPPAAFVIR